MSCVSLDRFAAPLGFARERGFHARRDAAQVNFTVTRRVVGSIMLTGAIVFGLVGVAAGFTWDYVINRGK
ncbi:MAG TPA: hypothetical protein VHT05_10545 [Candidatus Elarobacter sp.]|nr:hypothetical protein [Candidatus Elarobacter sp.]